MIDLDSELLISFTEAARKYEKNLSTIHRWRLRGIRGVKLESLLIGGERKTSLEALERFFAKSTAVADGVETPPTRSNVQRKKAIAAAERELQIAGI